MRASGILMHITSLPGPGGVGTMGREARAFVDFLAKAGQKYWQILPLGPTGHGDSPYQTDSIYAGNPYLIDLDGLVADGLLTQEEICAVDWGDNAASVDYAALYEGRFSLLEKAWRRGWQRDRKQVAAFEKDNARWLPDYALFRALKKQFDMKPWNEWPDEDAKLHNTGAVLTRYGDRLREHMEQTVYTQYLFHRQWTALREYARKKGVSIIGDVPIYVPMDSADVWAESHWFQLDDKRRPEAVAGVPPDYFSADGQLWGNPLYDWERMERDGFGWWMNRLRAAEKLYDVVRIDHFRGLESYWAVPYGEETARNGAWRKGPGKSFITAIRNNLPGMQVIAEDLGFLTEEVMELLAFSGYPGMKVLQFAFDSREPSDYLPHRYGRNCVCYTGTHDNATLAQWLEEVGEEDLAYAREYLGIHTEADAAMGILRAGMASVAELFVSQMQDWLGLGREARMNEPGILGHGNWCWRMLPGALTDELAEKIGKMTRLYGR